MAFDFPTPPSPGQTYTPAGGKTYVWDGVAWRVSGAGLTTSVIVSDGPPGGVPAGSLWWESDTGNTFLLYDDGDSQQWVQFNVSNTISNYISSIPADMWAGFKTSGNRFVVNDKADGTGSDILTVNRISGAGVAVLSSVGATSAAFQANKGASGNWTGMSGHTNGALRWALQLGDASAESSGNAGSGFVLSRYSDAGAFISNVLTAARTQGGSMNSGTFSSGAGMLSNTGHFYVNGGGLGVFDGGGAAYISTTAPAMGAGSQFVYQGPGVNVGLAVRNIAAGTAAAMQFIYYTTANGSITSNGTATAFNTTSDIRLKANMRDVRRSTKAEAGSARAFVDALRVVEYTPVEPVNLPEGHRGANNLAAIEDVEPPANPVHFGIPAQQAYTIFPDAVTPPDIVMEGYDPDAKAGEDNFRPWMTDYSKYVPLIMANTQDNNDRIDALEAQVAALEARLAALEGGAS